MEGQRTIPLVPAEGPTLSDEERARGLAEPAERIVASTWLDRQTLAHTEQLTDDGQ